MNGRRDIDEIDEIFVHHSRTPNGRAMVVYEGEPLAYDITTIDEWHGLRGFQRCVDDDEPLQHVGYHYVIHIDGVVGIGRSLSEIPAANPPHNRRSVAICMVGTTQFTEDQWGSLGVTISAVQKLLRAPADIRGHYELGPGNDHREPRICPGFDVAAWCERGRPMPENVCVAR